MFSFAMTNGLASDSDKFEITIALRRAQKFEDTGPNNFFLFFCLLNLTRRHEIWGQKRPHGRKSGTVAWERTIKNYPYN